MKLTEIQQTQIREQLEKYILSGLIDRDQRTPILVGSKNGDLIEQNGEYFDRLKIWIEKVSGKRTDWVAGVDKNEAFLGLSFIKNTTQTEKGIHLVKEYRFVIELKPI